MAALVSTLRVGCWNVRGLSASIPCLRELLGNTDIFCISEHWLHRNRLNCLDEISNEFSNTGCASRASSEDNFGMKRGQGGVAIFWRKELSGVSVIEGIKHDRICALRMQDARGVTLVIMSVYLPAAGAKDDLSSTLDDLSNFIDNLDDDVVPMICGDFNGDMGISGGPRGVGNPNRAGRLVANFMKKYHLMATNLHGSGRGPINTFNSHNGSTCIDYIMIPDYMEDKILACEVLDDQSLNTSDHLPITLCIKVDKLPCKINVQCPKKRIKWDKWDNDKMRREYEGPLSGPLADLNTRIMQCECNSDDIDGFFDELTYIVHKAAEVVPHTKFVNHLKPYWDDELSTLKKEKMKHFKIWKENGRSRDSNDPIRINMCVSKKKFAKRVRQISKGYYNEQIANATKLAEVDRNLFWKVFRKSKGGNTSSSHAIKKPDGKVVYTIDEILCVWHDHFDNISNPKYSEEYNHEHYRHVTRSVKAWSRGKEMSPFLNTPFDFDELHAATMKLHLNKAPGYDNISTEHIRFAGPHMIIEEGETR